MSVVQARAVSSVIVGQPSQVRMTFDDLGDTYMWGRLPGNYGGLSWHNFAYFDTTEWGYPGSEVAATSGKQVLGSLQFGPGDFSFSFARGSFTLGSMAMTAAAGPISVDVMGYSEGTLVRTRTVTLSTDHASLLKFGWRGIDTVTFSPHLIENNPWSHSGFFIDDLALRNFDTYPVTVRSTATFETLDGGQTGEPIRAGFRGLNWDGFVVHDTTADGVAGATSGHIVAQAGADGASITLAEGVFDIASLDIAAAHADALRIRIDGYVDGVHLYSKTVRASDTAAKTVALDWHGVDAVTFDGVTVLGHQPAATGDTDWTIDNVTFGVIHDGVIGHRGLITFDDLDGPLGDYKGLHWTTFRRTLDFDNSGGQAVCNQQDQSVATFSIDGHFDLESLQVHALLGQTVEIRGFADGELRYVTHVTLGELEAQVLNLGWQGIDRVRFDTVQTLPDTLNPPLYTIDDIQLINVVRDPVSAPAADELLHADVFEASARPLVEGLFHVAGTMDMIPLVHLV